MKQLIEKFNNHKAAAQLDLDTATKALETGDIAAYEAAKARVEEHKAQMAAYKSQIDNAQEIEGMEVAEPVVKSAPVRVPFEEDVKETPQKDESVTKSIAYLRYGDTPDALNVIMKDIYGPAYNEKREGQKAAFSKYLRYGDSKLRADEGSLLNELILTPESIS